MAITWRPATWLDIESSLLIQVRHRGEAVVGVDAALECWRGLVPHGSFTATTLQASPAIRGEQRVGFGAAVIVPSSFMDAELANPLPDINSRLIAGIHDGQAVVATRSEVARANAAEGIDILILCGVWRDDILSPEERHEVKTLLATSLTERYAGYRIRRIVCEAVDELGREFIERSVIYEMVADFPGEGRSLHLMTPESVRAVPGSLGNVLFNHRKPVLRLRGSDQQMLLAALGGATDQELACALGVTFSAVKARWRSTFARVAAAQPELVSDIGGGESRGSQKRHRVLAYVRSHPEELRPYEWKPKI